MYSPLEQFEIIIYQPLILSLFSSIKSLIFLKKYLYFFTNTVLYSVFSFISMYFFMVLALRERTVFSINSWEIIVEEFYIFMFNVLDEQVAEHWLTLDYLGLMTTIFIFIAFSNILGLTPYGFTTTSFIINVFVLSFGLLLGITILGYVMQGKRFLLLFVPSGVPKLLLPMLIFIEVVSYISRAFSLAIRLFANMMSGHSLLHILSGFCITLFKKSFLFGILPFIIILAISFLEIGIAILQAYVFVVLLSIYMNDALHGHDLPENNQDPYDPKLNPNIIYDYEHYYPIYVYEYYDKIIDGTYKNYQKELKKNKLNFTDFFNIVNVASTAINLRKVSKDAINAEPEPKIEIKY